MRTLLTCLTLLSFVAVVQAADVRDAGAKARGDFGTGYHTHPNYLRQGSPAYRSASPSAAAVVTRSAPTPSPRPAANPNSTIRRSASLDSQPMNSATASSATRPTYTNAPSTPRMLPRYRSVHPHRENYLSADSKMLGRFGH